MGTPSPSSTAPSEIGRWIAQAVALSRGGQLAQAEQLCRQVLAVRPAEPTALHVLGVCLLQRGQYAAAEQALAACLQAQPGEPAALGNRGIALQALRRFDEALACYARSLALAPAQPATLNMQGLALMELKRFDQALASFDLAVAIAPDFAEAWCSRANALIHLRQYDQALQSLDRAEALRPAYGEALSNRAIVLNLLGRHDQALVAARRALALLPDHPTIHRNLGDALAGLEHNEQALDHYNRAVELAPDDRALLIARADLLAALRRDDEAARDYATSLAMADSALAVAQRGLEGRSDPTLRSSVAQAHYERGLLLVDMGRHADAVEDFVQSTRLEPHFVDAHWSEALNRLRLGDFEEGWPKYEWRRRKPDFGKVIRGFKVPDWTGEEDPAGLRILLHAEQGLGDALQFCRYAPLLAQRGAEVVLLVHPPLKRLMASLRGVTVVSDGEPLPDIDRHCPIMSLPFAFRTSLATVPANVPYLHAERSRVDLWEQVLGPRHQPRIGLAWSGNPRHANDRARSISPARLGPLLELRAEFVSLAKEIREDERDVVEALPLRRLGEQVEDFADTAALMQHLDLIVTVDTAVAHLAGALGRPVWVLLDSRPDFRWLMGREDSPWYPTARLLRQQAHCDWRGVIGRVTALLADFIDAQSFGNRRQAVAKS